jgi:hypothetical protein
MHYAHPFGFYLAVSLLSKTAARRPHRWMRLVETNRLVLSAGHHDEPLRSYSRLKIARRAATKYGIKGNIYMWKRTRAVGVRESD